MPELDGKILMDFVHYQLEHNINPSGAKKWKNLLDFLYFLKEIKWDPEVVKFGEIENEEKES